MHKGTRFPATICILIVLAVPSLAQQPCQAGSLASVLGTSCSVGPLILNFPGFFNGGGAGTNPATVGFIPVRSGNQAGFTLVTNFVEDGSGGLGHIIQFEYTPQAATDFEIRAADLTMDAAAQTSGQGFAFVQILDFQDYPNAGFTDTGTDIDIEQGTLNTFQLSSHVILQVPDFVSTGFSLAPFTTQVFSAAGGGATASLTSATFLYTLGAVIPAPSMASLTYTNIDLPGVASTTVSNINNAGRMVGTFQDAQGVFHGYLAGRDGAFTVIDFPGATGTFGEGLNDHGDVTGFYNDAAGVSHGFTLERGNFATIDFPGGLFTQPIAINNRGQVVGSYESADQGFHAFLFDNGQFTTIDQGPGTGIFASTFAAGINSRGEILGEFFDPDTFRGFVERDALFQDFDVPGQGNTLPEGMNDQGGSVGAYDDINLVQHGFVKTGDSFRTIDFPGADTTFALGINASGRIVGDYFDSAGNIHSFLAEPSPDNGSNILPSTAADPRPNSKPVCGSDAWKERVKRLRDMRCRASH
jgi:probable HAF family extracellular repeat protein